MIENNAPVFCEQPHRGERFLEVCLLMLLAKDISHGYALLEQLEQLGFVAEQVNISTLYRTLRQMEAKGAVASDWESGGPGPQRRVYHLTEFGRQFLDEWIEVLKNRRTRIDRLIQAYEGWHKEEEYHLNQEGT